MRVTLIRRFAPPTPAKREWAGASGRLKLAPAQPREPTETGEAGERHTQVEGSGMALMLTSPLPDGRPTTAPARRNCRSHRHPRHNQSLPAAADSAAAAAASIAAPAARKARAARAAKLQTRSRRRPRQVTLTRGRAGISETPPPGRGRRVMAGAPFNTARRRRRSPGRPGPPVAGATPFPPPP